MQSDLFSSNSVEQFLYWEAELIDDWRLPEWADLYTDDARYEIASLDSEDQIAADPAKSLFVLADDKSRIAARATRLMKRSAHAEFPRSKVRHLITNVRVKRIDASQCTVKANFVVYRTRGDLTVRYMGEAHYTLIGKDGCLQIQHKRMKLDLNALTEQGRITVIL